MPASSRLNQLLLLTVFTLAIHAPFLGQGPQADEVNYLDIASQVFEHPATPLDFSYVFQGHVVDMGGHSHPPLNAYFLALIWGTWGRFSPPVFHAVYLIFALGISFAAYSIAAQFTSQPLWAAVLVTSAPVIQVAAGSLETDAPALALLLAGVAFFLARRFLPAGLFLALAGFTALQALAVVLILPLDYFLRRERPPWAAWCAVATPFLLLGGWQMLQLLFTGHLPAATMIASATGTLYGKLSLRGLNTLALIGHFGMLVVLLPGKTGRWLVFLLAPIILTVARGYAWWEMAMLVAAFGLGLRALVWTWEERRAQPFLVAWCLLYFVFSMQFFAGAARYLMPLAAPFVILVVREFEARPRVLAALLGVNLAIGLSLSFANYELARVHAQAEPPPGRVFLVNGEWGFRYRMSRLGGEMITDHSVPRPGEWMVTSQLALGGNYGSLAESLAIPIYSRELTSSFPVRLLDRTAHSGFYTTAFGMLPFSFSTGPLDRITYSRTSPFWKLDLPWTPTVFNGKLVYVPDPGAEIRIPVTGQLRFALFARGTGRITFRVQPGFEKTVDVKGELWEEHTLRASESKVVLRIDPAPGMICGWGELID